MNIRHYLSIFAITAFAVMSCTKDGRSTVPVRPPVVDPDDKPDDPDKPIETPTGILYSQFFSGNSTLADNIPESGAILMLNFSGQASLSSVKVRAVGGEKLCGGGDRSDSEVVVNCTEKGNFINIAAGKGIPVLLKAGTFSKGLEVVACSADHKMVTKTLSIASLEAGKTRTETIPWAPAANLVFYEGFDNCVWGGNIIAGSGSMGWSPDASAIGIADGYKRDGYDVAATAVEYNVPGTGFIQSNTWADCKGKSVGSSHVVSNSYVTSRNFADWGYLFRCQEYHGVMAVGTGNDYRGVLQTPPFKGIKGLSDVTISFKYCPQNGMQDDLLIHVFRSGVIQSCKIDGKEITPLKMAVNQLNGEAVIGRNQVTIPASAAEAKTWHEVELTVANATDGTALYLAGNDSDTPMAHGFWVDDITVKLIAGDVRRGNVRLMYWNVQNGMWADQQNDYENFIAFVNKYQPDICVWCESATIYKNNSDADMPSADRFLPNGWKTLMKEYGHSSWNLSGWRDNYPQAITAKYSITAAQKITGTSTSGKPISHGAGHFQLTVNGKRLNIVTCHMWPKNYTYGASSGSTGGDEYRAFEMDYIVSKTINNSAYSGEKYWILLGDMNSLSRLDIDTYDYDAGSTKFLTQDVVLNKTNLQDVIATKYPAPNFISSTYGKDRRDFIYLSPDLMSTVGLAWTFADSFTPGTKLSISNFSMPSDHRPFIVDFQL